MKKLLLPLTFICFFVSNSVMARQTAIVETINESQLKDFKKTNTTTVAFIDEKTSRQPIVAKSSRRNSAKKKRIIKTNNSNRILIKKGNHRDMIAKRTRIVANY